MNRIQKQKAPIVFERGVVKNLSLGLYRNFALAIKEVISNSYDAGATEVKLKLDLENRKIILRDNGRGMSEKGFKDEYLHIGYFKEPSKKADELGRMRIGTFGIGFLAPLPYCKTMRIITKKRGHELALEGEIRAEDFFTKGNWEINETGTEAEYMTYESNLPSEEGETIVVLENIKNQIYDELKRDVSVRRTIEGSGYEKFRWTLAQYCPIQFPPEREDLREFFGVPNRKPMRLWLDGEELFRNVPKDAQILEKDSTTFGEISLKYTIMSPNEPVRPEEARGFQLRLKDVAIGFPRDFDVTKLGRVLGKRTWLCGEVHITEGLDNALLVNRDSFNFTQDVADMYEFFRGRITHWDTRLYSLAEDDREVYLALGELKNDERVTEGLKKADALHFSKSRLRLAESYLTKSKSRIVENPVDKVVQVLKKKSDASFKVVRQKGKVKPDAAAIEVEKNSRTIYVHEKHAVFIENIEFYGKEYKVEYDEWNPKKTPYSICKIGKANTTAIFNKIHPLFKGKLSDNIVKRLSLGILIILENTQDKDRLVKEFNRLIEDIFPD